MNIDNTPVSNYFDKAKIALKRLNQVSQQNPFSKSEENLSCLKDILANIEAGNKTEVIPWGLSEKLRASLRNEIGLTENKILALKIIDILKGHKSALSKALLLELNNTLQWQWEIINNIHLDCLKGGPLELRNFSPSSCQEIIIAKLSSKGVPFEVKSGESDVLGGVLANLFKESTQKEIAVAVKAYTLASSWYSSHVMPLILRRTHNEIEILCTDSIGRVSTGWMVKLTRFLKAQFITEKKVPIKLYTLSIMRQRDSENCAIFAIDDICHYFTLKHKGFDLFAFVKKQAHLIDTSSCNDPLTVYDFELLPPSMMKLTQSIEQIKTYMENNPEFSKEIIKAKNQEILVDNLNRYCFMSEYNDQKVLFNCHAKIKGARYAAMLIKNRIETVEKEMGKVNGRPSDASI
jgi:hypothetical protein